MNNIENINIPNKKEEYMPEFLRNCGFISYNNFKKYVKEALKASKNGGYKESSIYFLKYVFHNINQFSPNDLRKCRKEVNIAINRIKLEEKEKREASINNVKKNQEKEKERTGIHPEDFNSI